MHIKKVNNGYKKSKKVYLFKFKNKSLKLLKIVVWIKLIEIILKINILNT